jgi:hypothetical protein
MELGKELLEKKENIHRLENEVRTLEMQVGNLV